MPSAVKPSEQGDMDLELRDLTVELPRGEAMAQELDAVHLGLCAALAIVTLHRRQMVRPMRFDVRRMSLRAMAPAVSGFHGFVFLRVE